jgi:SAM-dependent methyltransferase
VEVNVWSKVVQASLGISSVVRRSLRRFQRTDRQLPDRQLVEARTSHRRDVIDEDKVVTRYPMATTSDYYQHVHKTNSAYQTNNWLLPEIEAILSITPKSILEVGCGNGRFLAAVKGHVEEVIGIDWARSPILDEMGASANFQLRDITRDELPKVDIVCSADVLEHIPPELLRPTIERLDRAGPYQYHVIACYDDGHSHLSIMPPEAWLDLFQSVSRRYDVVDVRPRRDDPSQVVCVIATFQPKTQRPGHYHGMRAKILPPSARER